MWNLIPPPGIEPRPPALEHGILATGPPGKSLKLFGLSPKFCCLLALRTWMSHLISLNLSFLICIVGNSTYLTELLVLEKEMPFFFFAHNELYSPSFLQFSLCFGTIQLPHHFVSHTQQSRSLMVGKCKQM